MASINPFVAPNSGDTPWVDQIRKTLKTQLAVTVDTPPSSIYEVPKIIKDEKPAAYEPQRIGLGPKHHFRADLYSKMEQNKLTAVKRVLKPIDIPECEDQVVDRLKEVVPLVSACYYPKPEIDIEALAWIFAIDGIFLIDQLHGFSDHAADEQDLIMLENQIPLVVLQEIEKVLLLSGENGEDYWEPKFQYFAKSNSPFVLSRENVEFSKVHHLLDYLYRSIVNNESTTEVSFKKPGSVPIEKPATEELLEAVIQAAGLIPGAKPFLGILESIEKILYESEDKNVIREINVPSVSQLRDIAKVKFVLLPETKGIRNIKFENGELALPVLRLDYDSEVILRNLTAYEKLMAKNSFMAGFGLELTEYVDFMCGIIDDANDVKLLRELKIIQGDLRDKDIVDMFNGIGRSLGNMNGQSNLRKTAAKLNEVYGNIPTVKFKNEVEKQVRASAKALTFLVSISGTLVLAREAYSKISADPSQMVIQFFSQQFGSFSSLVQ